jgi:hypothetical protein
VAGTSGDKDSLPERQNRVKYSLCEICHTNLIHEIYFVCLDSCYRIH